MSSLNHLQALMAEIGPLVEAITEVQQQGKSRWMIPHSADKDTVVEIDFVEESKKLIFSIDSFTSPFFLPPEFVDRWISRGLTSRYPYP